MEFVGIRLGFGRRDGTVDIEDVDRDHSIFVFCSDHQHASTLSAQRVDRAVEKLQANLKKLARISEDAWQFRLQDGAEFNVLSFPLRLRQLDGGAEDSIDIHWTHGGVAGLGKTDQAGNQRFGAANMLSDL